LLDLLLPVLPGVVGNDEFVEVSERGELVTEDERTHTDRNRVGVDCRCILDTHYLNKYYSNKKSINSPQIRTLMRDTFYFRDFGRVQDVRSKFATKKSQSCIDLDLSILMM
jgi:hypothetical protein